MCGIQILNIAKKIRRPRRGHQACEILLVSGSLFWAVVWGRFSHVSPPHPPHGPCTPACESRHSLTVWLMVLAGAVNRKNTKKHTFSRSGMSPKSRHVYFLETKAPAGAPLSERSFWKLTQIKLIHLEEISKSDISPKVES